MGAADTQRLSTGARVFRRGQLRRSGDAEFADQWFSFTGKENMVMFGSSYPHWHCWDVSKLPRALTAEQREKVCWRNAAELYGIDIPVQLAAQ
ncbi:amidohydrolase family protein [Mycobacterium xenopi 3993]|nr:amidohydrolase family protein [Mycobacterium xenopi 3993]